MKFYLTKAVFPTYWRKFFFGNSLEILQESEVGMGFEELLNG